MREQKPKTQVCDPRPDRKGLICSLRIAARGVEAAANKQIFLRPWQQQKINVPWNIDASQSTPKNLRAEKICLQFVLSLLVFFVFLVSFSQDLWAQAVFTTGAWFLVIFLLCPLLYELIETNRPAEVEKKNLSLDLR